MRFAQFKWHDFHLCQRYRFARWFLCFRGTPSADSEGSATYLMMLTSIISQVYTSFVDTQFFPINQSSLLTIGTFFKIYVIPAAINIITPTYSKQLINGNEGSRSKILQYMSVSSTCKNKPNK